MNRVLVLLCCGLLAAPVHAQQGYAFDQPEILATQRLWGIAHGARLLAHACTQAGKGEAAEAWVEWQERELPQILSAGNLLAKHYFGEDAAPPDAIAKVLGLKQALALPPEQLEPACATFAEALALPRYDLAKRYEELLKVEPKP
ncbi:MAG: hypothetical protein Q8M20_13020 [Rhodocyclaceae bacterium]|nr:hypothetical protein [Rhodocyclaceae bacterium]MDZ4215919.1 hypothetical protein [Rhodocyclaceae bacterium]